MPFLEFLFSPQAHKFCNGYSINHDTILNVSQEARRKLIFYFIAEQLPQKLERQDRIAYEAQRTKRIGLPRALWTLAAFVGPLALQAYRRPGSLRSVSKVGLNLILGAALTPFATALYSRIYEARYVESNELIDQLAKKYNYGIWDFSVAKKQSHILSLLHTMDAPYDALHS